MARKDRTGVLICYEETFEYKGHTEKYYIYELSFKEVVEGIRHYFFMKDVTIDGKDSCIWNAIADLDYDCLSKIIEEVTDYLLDFCRENAYNEWVEGIEEMMELEDE